MKSAYYPALVAFAVLVLATTLQAEDSAHSPEDTLSVSVIALSKVAIPVERDVEAKLISPNDTPVSPELAARVLKIEADVGDEVREGDVLARLDCRDYDVKLRQAQAGVLTVKARIQATAARVGAAESRVAAAGSRAGASESQVGAATSRVNAAVSRVQAATAGVQAATARMQSTGTGINTAKSRVNTAKAQANAARARIPGAQAQFKLAQAELNRNRQLRNQKLIPANVLDQAQAAFNSAQSSLTAAQADYAAAQAAVSTANEEINAAAANLQAGKADVASSRANVETIKAELGSSKADLGTAKANLGTAKADIDTARADLEGAKADLLTVETELENALAQQEAAEVVTGRCLVTAPFDGQITQRLFQLGQISSPGMAAFQLLQHQGLEVIAQLSPDEVRDQEQGEKVRFVSDGVELEVERRAVVAQVASDSGTQEVRYRVNSQHNLPVGKTGRVRWQGKLPAIPPDWLLRREGGLGLMLAVDGKAEFYPLKNAREGQATLIDLPDNTLLIDANRLRARNGQKIEQAGE